MRVLLLANSSNAHLRRIESAVSLLNSCQKYYRVEFRPICDFAKTGNSVSPGVLAERLEQTFANLHVILSTEDPFDDNWFSHEYRTSAVITTSDWESTYAPPSLRAYLIYQVAQALIHFSADMSEEMAMNLVHDSPIGCIYDMAIQKSDIKFGMLVGNICHRCIGELRALGTPESSIEAVRQVVGLVRAEALGMPMLLDPSEVFVVMRFTQNDENDHAWKYGIKRAVEQSGLRPTRGDDRVESTHILTKVEGSIRRSRLVIAKVDENNLNVYFELGLAMGLQKDVLLISESSLTVHLPSDLRSWECLTYDKGNYDQLLTKLEVFLRAQYHL